MKRAGGNPCFACSAAAATLALLVACIGPVRYDTGYSELESVWQYLKAYSIYQDSSIYIGRLPDDPFVYSDPAEMIRTIGDTLYGIQYTVYGISVFCGSMPQENIADDGYVTAAALASLAVLDTLTDSTVRITIRSFEAGVFKQFTALLPGVDPFPKIIVDLRGNGGGDIVQTDSIIDAFIPSGYGYIMARSRDTTQAGVYYTHDWHIKKTKNIMRPELKIRNEIKVKPLTVLMDHKSASAAEILIAALKDCGNATLVGSRSFGKGIGQIKIIRRDRPALQITFLQMRGVSERIGDYHRRGIEPDIAANGSEEEVLLAAVRVHEPSATRLRRLRKTAAPPTPVGAYRIVWE